jgi:hypothetical protein
MFGQSSFGGLAWRRQNLHDEDTDDGRYGDLAQGRQVADQNLSTERPPSGVEVDEEEVERQDQLTMSLNIFRD